MWRPDRSADRLSPAESRELEALDRALAGGPPLDEQEAALAGLVVAVRDGRPPLRPGFAAELDARVAAGFPRRPGAASGPAGAARARGRRRERRGRMAGLGVAAALAAGVVVVAGGPGDPTVRQVVSVPASRPSAPARGSVLHVAPPGAVGRAVPAPGAAAAAGTAPAVAPSPGPVTAPAVGARPGPVTAPFGAAASGPAVRAVERGAALALLAPRGHVQDVADRVIAATDRLGGVVESSNVAVDDQGGSQASLELRVASGELDRTLAALSALAHVSSRSQSAQDITDATGSARDRLAESRAEREALLGQLARATTANQVASLHARLGLLAGRIGADQARLASLVAQGAFAQLSVTIAEGGPGAGGAGARWGPGTAFAEALGVLEAVFAVVIIALAGLLPAAALAGLAWWGAGPLRRRRREAALAATG